MTERRKILFVDDETNVLEALQRMLRSRRNEWDMRFMNRPEDALTLMASESFHVVVSDMRMPGMDGSRFLGEVSARHPDVVRIILSGQSDRESLLHTTSLAHQFLSKPCDSETLKTAIDNVSNLHELLKNEALRRMISQLDALPSLPLPYLDLMRELRSAHASVDRVGRIIARDMGMTAKILHLANSAFFGVRLRVTDPALAATLLGLETIKSLVLSVQVFRKFDLDAISFFSPEQLWEHSIVVGRLAQEMARETRRDDTFIHASLMAGLMHDIGKLVFAAKFASDWRIALSESASSGEPAIEAERRVLGAEVCTLGLLDSAPVHPREVFKRGIELGASQVILSHNHPSGNPAPSKEDRDITRRLDEAAKLIGLQYIEHIITDGDKYYSLASESLEELAGPGQAAWESAAAGETRRRRANRCRIESD